MLLLLHSYNIRQEGNLTHISEELPPPHPLVAQLLHPGLRFGTFPLAIRMAEGFIDSSPESVLVDMRHASYALHSTIATTLYPTVAEFLRCMPPTTRWSMWEGSVHEQGGICDGMSVPLLMVLIIAATAPILHKERDKGGGQKLFRSHPTHYTTSVLREASVSEHQNWLGER